LQPHWYNFDLDSAGVKTMVLLETPICNFGENAHPFTLPDVDGELWTLERAMGPRGVLVMFICNHCPYVKAIREKLVRDTRQLAEIGIGSVAIMSRAGASVSWPAGRRGCAAWHR
jgi:hypothetical protein